MDNNSKEKNKSLRRAMTAEKLTEMLREIDISAAVENSGLLPHCHQRCDYAR